MKNSFKNYIRTIVLLCFFFLPIGITAKSENLESVVQALNRIEKDVEDLQKEVYRNKNIYSSGDSVSIDNNVTVFDLRIRDIENSD